LQVSLPDILGACPNGQAPFSLSKKARSHENVGASIARPPKIFDFRIFRRKITFFRLAAMDFALQNPRTTNGRPYTLF
jgi:hypothetical protein